VKDFGIDLVDTIYDQHFVSLRLVVLEIIAGVGMYCFKFSYDAVITGCEYFHALTAMQETKESHDLIEIKFY